MLLNRFLLILTALSFIAGLVAADQPAAEKDPRLLTLERLYSSEEFDAKAAPETKWLDGGSRYTTLEPSTEVEDGTDIVAWNTISGERKVIVPARKLISPKDNAPFEIEAYEWSPDGAKVLVFTNAEYVWRTKTRGDYWLVNLDGSQLNQIGAQHDPATLMFAKLSPTGDAVAYVQRNDLYVEDLRSRNTKRLTSDGTPTTINGTFDWAYEEEFGLRDGFRWSPDGRRIFFWHLDASPVREFRIVDNTTSSYPEITEIPYPKVGEKNSLASIGVVEITTGTVHWLKVPGHPTDSYIPAAKWADSGEILVQRLNRLQNSQVLLLCDATNGACRELMVETDAAWIDIFGNQDPEFFAGGKRFAWLSERDGWRHLYLVGRQSGETLLLTPGAYDVVELVSVDERSGRVYFIASPANAATRFLFQVPLDGSGKLERVTPEMMTGTHGYDISPNGRHAIHTWSGMTRPPATDLVTLPGHRTVRILEDNHQIRQRVEALEIGEYEFFKIDIGDDVVLDGWCLKPSDFDAGSKYPVLFNVYGEPAGQTVRDRWRRKTALWHAMLAQRGYVVISVDNRGTPAPRGRDWRKVVYRQIGILASEEQAAAVHALAERWPWIDTSRLGIWGWSGGGSMTLNMMFRYPGLFKMGISVAPVANQLLYDSIYQERYMGLPDDNEEGYRLGSPVTFAHQLEGELLVVHGTADDNVHYQNTEILVNELIKHNKPFTMMAYPGRAHSIREGENTTRHLYELLTRFLGENLPTNRR